MLGINQELKKLEEMGRRIKVGLIGTGQMGTDIISQVSIMKGIKIVAAADLDINRVIKAYQIAGLSDRDIVKVNNIENAEFAIEKDRVIATDDFRIVTDLNQVDLIIEATGSPEIGAKAGLRTIFKQKHLVMMNVETDITIGPIMKWYADQQGIIYSLASGDEPTAIQELYDFTNSLGLRVIVTGKGKNNPLDRSATPDKFEKEAVRRGLTPNMLVEFIDGTKTMIEMAAVSNSTGLIPDIRGMHGPHIYVKDLLSSFKLEEEDGILNNEGVVDYVIGDLAPGVFLIFKTDQPRLKECLVLRDMGSGPNYLLIRPYHLCSMEVPLTVARAIIQKQNTMAPQYRLVSEVLSIAKVDIPESAILESIGGATHYGLIDRFEVAVHERALPIGLAKGSIALRNIKKGEVICYHDVSLPQGSTVIILRQLQDKLLTENLDSKKLLTQIEAVVRSQL